MQENMLFEDEFGPAGYRLQCVEIYNWGVFDKEIYKISPEGNTSLLTGANGSGKTSFVDAILTLIVPERRMRFYNFSLSLLTGVVPQRFISVPLVREHNCTIIH